MRPGVLGGLGWLLLVPALYAAALDWVTARKLRDAWRGADAVNGELEEGLACDLVFDFVQKNEGRRKVSCKGALVVSGEVARFTEVKVDWETRSFCFARTPAWQVLRSAQAMPCFPTPPPDLSRPVESENARVKEAAVALLAERLEGIRRAMASDVRPARCSVKSRTNRGEVPLLEYELLLGSGSESWAFLSTPWLREAVLNAQGAPAIEALRSWREGRPWVAVVTSSSRTEARAGRLLGDSWTRGHLSGTLALIDAEAGELLCEAPFTFSSSASLERVPATTFGKRRYNLSPILQLETDERVQGDFHKRYQSEATRTLNEMTGYAAWPLMH